MLAVLVVGDCVFSMSFVQVFVWFLSKQQAGCASPLTINLIIIIKVFLKHKIISLETILSMRTHTHTHTSHSTDTDEGYNYGRTGWTFTFS